RVVLVQEYRLADHLVQAVEIAQRRIVAAGHRDRRLATAHGLLGAQRIEHVLAGRVGPVFALLELPTGGEYAGRDVRTHHDDLVVARRRLVAGGGVLGLG